MKYGINIATSSLLSFIKIHTVAISSTVCFAIACFNVIFKDSIHYFNQLEGATIWLKCISVATHRPLAILIPLVVTILSPVAAYFFGNMYILQKISKKIIEDKSEHYVKGILEKAFLKIEQTTPQLLEKGTNAIKLKLQLIEEIKKSDSKKWLKRTVMVVLSALNLDEMSLESENFNIKDSVISNVMIALNHWSSPNRIFIYIIIFTQILIFILLKMTIL